MTDKAADIARMSFEDALAELERIVATLEKGQAPLEESIRLNDNRRLYRSEFLLDEDRAVRGANLARIYQNSGMKEVAVREATRAAAAAAAWASEEVASEAVSVRGRPPLPWRFDGEVGGRAA